MTDITGLVWVFLILMILAIDKLFGGGDRR